MIKRHLSSRFLMIASLFSLLLASCSSLETAPTAAVDAFEPLPLASGIARQSLLLPDWQADAGLEAEVLGVGLGNRFSALSSASINIPDPDSVAMLYVQVIFKAGQLSLPTLEFVAPNNVTLSTSNEVKSLASGTIGLADLVDGDGMVLDNIGRIYETILAPAASVNLSIDGIGRTNLRTPRALVVYVLRESSSNTRSTGRVSNYYLYGQAGYVSASETLSIIPSNNSQDLEVNFSIAELGSDSRIAELYAEAGGVSAQATVTLPSEGDELLLYTLTLPNVPAGTSSVSATVSSPRAPLGQPLSEYGDSFFWHGLNVAFVTDPEPEPEPEPELEFGACTPGYWRNHTGQGRGNQQNSWAVTGYSPDALLISIWPELNQAPYNGNPQRMHQDSLLDGITYGGGGGAVGGARILIRAAMASLLNIAYPDFAYPEYSSTDALIADVAAALNSLDRSTMLNLADKLDGYNNAYPCPL